MILEACFYVTLTYYTLTGGMQDHAAFGGRVAPGETCAVSRDLKHLAGKDIWIEDVGVRRVNDKMGAVARQHVDVAAWRHEMKRLGKRKGVKICIVK